MNKKIIYLILLILLSISGFAYALDLQAAKNKQLVGESNTGYLVALSTDKNVVSLVSEVNEKRKEIYLQSSRNLGVDVEVFQLRMALKIKEDSQKGHMIQNENNQWVVK